MQTAELAMLHVKGKGPETDIPLDPAGMTIGRAPTCGVVLDSAKISRRHARIFQDPFGRWIVEDLGSRNGVWLGGEKVETRSILPGEALTIGPYTLTIAEPTQHRIEADPKSTATSMVVDDATDEPVVTGAVDDFDALSAVRLKQLNAIIDRLNDVTNPNELYPEVCHALARTPEMVAAVLRLPASGATDDGPKVLACHLGGRPAGEVDVEAENLHISRRVIDAVRSTGNAVMASSTRGSEQNLTLTVVDERRPRAVICSPMGEAGESVDVLYLDVPSGHATSEILDYIRAVARQVGFTRKGLLLSEARAERRVLDRQLNLARDIQAKLTPTNLACVPGADLALWYQPAMWVGGDYCDFWTLEDGRLAFAIGDVSGKGLPAAMVMSNLQAALRTTMSFCPRPAEAMARIDNHLSDSMLEQMFVTLILGVFDPAAGTLEYVNAGHILPVAVGADGQTATLGKPTNPPVGVFVGEFEAETASLNHGAAVVIVTDGITEAMSPAGEEFGPESFQTCLAGPPGRTAEAMVQIANNAAREFRNDMPQQDDITVFALRRVET